MVYNDNPLVKFELGGIVTGTVEPYKRPTLVLLVGDLSTEFSEQWNLSHPDKVLAAVEPGNRLYLEMLDGPPHWPNGALQSAEYQADSCMRLPCQWTVRPN